MNNNLAEQFFGPMSKKYCDYFYFLSVFGFIMMVVLFTSGLFVGLTKRKSSDYYFSLFMSLLMYGILYFQNRLIYSICIGTMKE